MLSAASEMCRMQALAGEMCLFQGRAPKYTSSSQTRCVVRSTPPYKASSIFTYKFHGSSPTEPGVVYAQPSIEQRLDHVEDTLGRLVASINQLLLKSSNELHHGDLPNESHRIFSKSRGTTHQPPQDHRDAPQATTEELHSFAAVDHAEHSLRDLGKKMEAEITSDHQAASKSLQELSTTLKSARLQRDPLNPYVGGKGKGYYIPPKSVGYSFMSRMFCICPSPPTIAYAD